MAEEEGAREAEEQARRKRVAEEEEAREAPDLEREYSVGVVRIDGTQVCAFYGDGAETVADIKGRIEAAEGSEVSAQQLFLRDRETELRSEETIAALACDKKLELTLVIDKKPFLFISSREGGYKDSDGERSEWKSQTKWFFPQGLGSGFPVQCWEEEWRMQGYRHSGSRQETQKQRRHDEPS